MAELPASSIENDGRVFSIPPQLEARGRLGLSVCTSPSVHIAPHAIACPKPCCSAHPTGVHNYGNDPSMARPLGEAFHPVHASCPPTPPGETGAEPARVLERGIEPAAGHAPVPLPFPTNDAARVTSPSPASSVKPPALCTECGRNLVCTDCTNSSTSLDSPTFSASRAPAPPMVEINRFDGDAFSYIGNPSQFGSTPSRGIFTRQGKRFYGKGQVIDAEYQESALRNALKELLANELYRHFGCHAQRLILSDQRWLPGSEMFHNGIKAKSGIHLMSEWIDGFSTFGPALVDQLQNGRPITVTYGDTTLPVRGLGQIIAVSMLLNDIDCIGGTGGNVGYTVVTDPETNAPSYVQAIKIDPGMSFHFSSRSSTGYTFLKYHEQLGVFMENASKGISYINSSRQFRACSLDRVTRDEFDECMAGLLALTVVDFRSFCTQPGLELLFPSDSVIHQFVVFLDQRRSALEIAFPSLKRAQLMRGFTSADCLSHIKSTYSLRAVLVDPITGAQHSVEDRFVNLNLLEKRVEARGEKARGEQAASNETEFASQQSLFGSSNSRSKIGQPGRREGGRAALVNSFDQLRAKRTPIAIEDVFSRCHGSTKRVNLTGGAGMGKSTCCQSIVSRWASGQLFSEFELLVWIPLRRLNPARYPSGDSYSVVDIIIQECLGVHPFPQLRAAVALLYDPAKALWILDGYDEIVGRVPDHLSSALTQMMSAPHRILTGRPHAMSRLTGELKGDADVEVVGFRDDDIESFAERFATGACINDAVLLEFLHRSPAIWELAHVPVNLVLMCHVFAEATSGAELSLTELYLRVETLMGRRFCAKVGKNLTSMTAAQQSDAVSPVFEMLSEIAYQAMKLGIVMIPGSSISSWLSTSTTYRDFGPDVSPNITSSGLLVQADGIASDPIAANWHFLHLTLQEFFAGKRIAAALCGDVPLPDDEIDWLRKRKYGHHLEVMWCFVGGLVAQGLHHSCPNHVGLTALADLWTAEPREIGRIYEARVWLRIIEEGRLWRLSQGMTPTVVLDALATARPYIIGDDGVPQFKSLSDPATSVICETLEHCPLLCAGVVLADDIVQQLAAVDLLELVNVVGISALHCDWAWTSLASTLPLQSDSAVGIWDALCPEVVRMPQLLGLVSEVVHAIVPPGVLNLKGMLKLKSDSEGFELISWMKAALSSDCSRLNTPRVPVRMLQSVSAELVRLPGIQQYFTTVLESPVSVERGAVIDILVYAGMAILSSDALVGWMCSWTDELEVHRLEDVLVVIRGIGESCLSLHWALLAISTGLQHVKDHVRLFALDAASSLLPFLVKHNLEDLAGDWIYCMAERPWDPSYTDAIAEKLRAYTGDWAMIPYAATLMTEFTRLSDVTVHRNCNTLSRALLIAAGSSLLSLNWFLDWIGKINPDSEPNLASVGLESLRVFAEHVLQVGRPLLLDFLIKCASSKARFVRLQSAMFFSDIGVDGGTTEYSCLEQLSLDRSFDVRIAAVDAFVKACPDRLLLKPACGEVVQRALHDGVNFHRLAGLFSHLPKLTSSASDAIPQLCVTDSRVFTLACRALPIVVQGLLVSVESPSGCFSFVCPHALNNHASISALESLLCELSATSFPKPESVLRLLGFDVVEEVACAVSLQAVVMSGLLLQSENAPNDLLDRVLYAMDAHCGSEDVQNWGCHVLEALACWSPSRENVHAIISGGGLRRISAAMNTHLESEDVQEWGCRVIAVLAESESNIAAIVSSDCIRRAIAAMSHHVGSVNVQHRGCEVLANLAVYESNSIVIVFVGGLDRLMVAMSAHTYSVDVQHCACWALSNMSMHEVNILGIVHCGALPRMFVAMRAHIDSVEVQYWCCRALVNLSRYDANQVTIVSGGGLDRVFAAMDAHKDSVDVQHYACWALAILAVGHAYKERIVSGGGVYRVFAAMDAHRGSSDVQYCSCWALANLAEIDANKVAIVSGGGHGLGCVFAAMDTHIGSVNIQREGLKLLANLNSPYVNSVAIVSGGGLDRVFAAMDAHRDSVDVQRTGCLALANLAKHDANKVAIVSGGGLDRVFAAMAAHLGDEIVQLTSCNALAYLAANYANSVAIVSDGGLDRVLAAMDAHKDSVDLQRTGYDAISSLAKHDANKVAIVSRGDLDRVLDAMDTHIGSVIAQRWGCFTIANLAVNEANKLAIVSGGGLDRVFAALDAHLGDEIVQQFGCNAIANVAKHEAISVAIVPCGGLHRVLAAMDAHKASVIVQQWGCNALATLAVNDANSVAIVSGGGLGRLFAAMDAHLGAEIVQYDCCRALANLVVNDAISVAIVSGGGLDRVLAAMDAHKASVIVQLWGCYSIANLAVNEANKLAIMSGGGLDRVLAAMGAHLGDEIVQQWGCKAIAYLAANDANSAAIVSGGGMDRVFAAMDTHIGSVIVQRWGCFTIANLAANDANSVAIVSGGGLDRVFAAMDAHLGADIVQENGCDAIAYLAANDANSVAIVSGGGLDRVFAAMDAHIGSVIVQRNGCAALASLAVNEANSVAIVSGGGLERLFAVLDAHKDSVIVQNDCCWALANLAVSEANKVAIVSGGGLDRVFTAMDAHLGAEIVQNNCCWALANLAENESNSVAIVSGGGLDPVLAAMDAHLGDEIVQLNCFRALEKLATNDANKVAIVFGGGLDRVFSALDAHKASVDVQRDGVRLLVNVANVATNRVSLLSLDAVSIAHQSQVFHPHSIELKTAIAELLGLLTETH